jgi:hypothetical protein
MELEMGIRKGSLIALTLLVLGLASGAGHAQQSTPPMSGSSEAGSAGSNATTGGAEGDSTDRGKPGASRFSPKTHGSASGSSGTANTMTGGAEGKPTSEDKADQSATPSSSDTDTSNSPAPQSEQK